MVIEDWISQNIDTRIRYTGSGDEIHICCPVCDEHRYRLYIGLKNGMVYCHNCGFKGSIVKLIQYVEHTSYAQASAIFDDVKGNIILPTDVLQSVEHKVLALDEFQVAKRPIPLPKEYQLLLESNQRLAHKAIRYLNSRAITNAQIAKHQMGFCAYGEYAGRVIIPIYQGDQLKFWVARAIDPRTKLKEKSPSGKDYHYSKSEVVFNIDRAARQYHTIVISEGIFDALSWGDVGVSLLGKTMYSAQLKTLLEYKPLIQDGVYVALDADAEDSAMGIANRLSDFFPEVYVVHIPPEFDDPNKYLQTHSRADMWGLLKEAERYEEFTALRSKLRMIANKV